MSSTVPCNDFVNEPEKNSNSASAPSSRTKGTSEAELASVSHAIPVDKAGVSDVEQHSFEHQLKLWFQVLLLPQGML